MSTAPTIWLNVTTSSAWQRPPVGIVRVELSLRDALARQLGARFRCCRWVHEQGAFIDVDDANDAQARPRAGDALLTLGLDWDQPYADYYAWAGRHGVLAVACCYDLIPLLFPQYCVPAVAQRFREYLVMMLWGAAGVLCISRRTEADLQDFIAASGAPARPTQVIALGDHLPADEGEVSPQVAALLGQPYLLFVSTVERRKNHEVLVRALQMLLREHGPAAVPRLVCVGMPGWHTGDLLHEIANDALLRDHIVMLHHVGDAELASLYRHAAFCVYPSLYEGWGLPVAEALASGKAVLASAEGAIPEVGGALVHYLPAHDTRAWADAILAWHRDPASVKDREARIRAAYLPRDWDSAARSAADFADRLLAERAQASHTLYPGHHFVTEVGLPVGATVRSTGQPGRLLQGARLALPMGRWRLSLFDDAAQRASGTLHVALLADGQVLQEADLALTPGSAPLAEFSFALPAPADALDLQVDIASGAVELTRVEITPASAPPPSAAQAIEPPSGTLAPADGPRRLYVDVSELIRSDARSGIQRVVRSVLAELRAHPPAGFTVVPVFATQTEAYRMAPDFDGGNQAAVIAPACLPLQPGRADIFLGLDLLPDLAVRHADFYAGLRLAGVTTWFVVYDLLPMIMPQHFSVDAEAMFSAWLAAVSQADGLVAISAAVADEVRKRVPDAALTRARPLRIGHFHLGADLHASLPTRGVPDNAADILRAMQARPSFLMVSTIEPRKGHRQALEAFERLWDAGEDVNLVIVGKRGWRTEALARVLTRNPENGRRLFWLEGISDEFLDQLYAQARCLLSASEGEGFGLPLIEAAQHGLPILARDLPVFREVAGDHARYFTGLDPDALAAAVRSWLADAVRGAVPASAGMPRLSWQQSVAQLLDAILEGTRPHG